MVSQWALCCSLIKPGNILAKLLIRRVLLERKRKALLCLDLLPPSMEMAIHFIDNPNTEITVHCTDHLQPRNNCMLYIHVEHHFRHINFLSSDKKLMCSRVTCLIDYTFLMPIIYFSIFFHILTSGIGEDFLWYRLYAGFVCLLACLLAEKWIFRAIFLMAWISMFSIV